MDHRTDTHRGANPVTGAPDDRLITETGARQIYERARALQQGDGRLVVSLRAEWKGNVRWARNRVSLASDERWIEVLVLRQSERGAGIAQTNQIDTASLAAAIRAAERTMTLGYGDQDSASQGFNFRPPLLPYPETTIWSDATYNATPEQRGALVRALTDGAEARQLLSAGFVQMRVCETNMYGPPAASSSRLPASEDPPVGRGKDRQAREIGYVRHTEAQCSMTVRHPLGKGSGWAGLSGYDWAVIDAEALAQRALDKCVQSLNPVAIEPGRYTVILEPPAVATFTDIIVAEMGNRPRQEGQQPGALSGEIDPTLRVRRSLLGRKVVDDRVTITHDPMNGQLGVVPELGLTPTTWIERGVLRTLGYDREGYAIGMLNDNLPALPTGSYKMEGGSSTIEEMIATTKRGLLVSRLSNVRMIREAALSLLHTGLTRDGLWLIEDGKIAQAVKNMRFTDSPLFVLNNVEQIGVTVPVFHPSDNRVCPVIVPTVKSRDFAFTATSDAV